MAMAGRQPDRGAETIVETAANSPIAPALLSRARGGKVTSSRLPNGTALGGGRFVLRNFLGEGGMGQVYEADDVTRGEVVALKKLHQIDARGIEDLKHEFRALVNVVHPNLVTFHELFADDDHWFFVMTLVRGVDFLKHVRADAATGFAATMAMRQIDPARAVRLPRSVAQGLQAAFYEHALRDSLRQLAMGVQAIHAAGILHRDLKPSNVLVSEEGRVVILDFGLAADEEDIEQGERRWEIVGTPSYMAPEQAAGRRAAKASDWYAVGAMMYEALTGEPPFRGGVLQVLAEKQIQEAPRPSSVVEGIPRELEELCSALLRRDPHERPSEREILDRLGALSPEFGPRSSTPSIASTRTPFVGRRQELDALRSALDATGAGRPVTVFVRGLSGMGKTALVDRFLKDLRSEGDALVLAGRCYERESVRYNAFDGVVDALCSHLRQQPHSVVEELAPRDVEALTRAFPAFTGVSALMRGPSSEPLPRDPLEIRRRTFGALKALLFRLAERYPIVVHVDDLQWADMDSARLMRALLSPPEAPALLFVGTYRSDEVDRSPFLREISSFDDGIESPDIRSIDLGPLRSAEEMELVTALLPEGHVDADSIRRESMGSPYFISELLRYAVDHASVEAQPRVGQVTFQQALAERIAKLPEDAQRALTVISVATAPIARHLLARALPSPGDLQSTLTTLRAANLVRAVGAGADLSVVTTYHDRIRETIGRALEPSVLRGWHASLARAFESSDDDNDLEALTDHLVGASEFSLAAQTAARAARRAAATLAFERAANLYAIAIEYGDHDREVGRDLQVSRAEALVHAGRGLDAAEDFFAAADGAPAQFASIMRRRAAAQLLRSGHVDRGIDILEDALAEFQIELPKDATLHFARLGEMFRQRGLTYVERSEREVPDSELARIDVCFETAIGLATINASCAGYMSVHSLLYALDAGEPFRILRGSAMYVLHVAAMASKKSRTIQAVLTVARDISQRLDSQEARAWWLFTSACADFWTGRSTAAAEALAEAEKIWRSACVGVGREIAQARYLLLLSLIMSGKVEEIASRVPGWIKEAEERSDLYLTTVLRSVSWPIWLGADDPARAESEVARVAEDLPRVADHSGWMVAVSYGHIDLYRGDAEGAWSRLASRWDGILGSTIAMLTVGRSIAFEIHGRLALARAAAGTDTGGTWMEASIAIAESDAEELLRIALPCFEPRVAVLRAGLATLRGGEEGRAKALGFLEQAERDFAGETGNAMGAACARRRRGQLLSDAGEDLVREADLSLRRMGIQDPARWTEMYAPGRY